MLADAGQRGSADPLFITWFTPELLDLVRDGLARAERDTTVNCDQVGEVVCIRITEAGQDALEKSFPTA